VLNLNPSGKCIGPTKSGCPYQADARPSRVEDGIETMFYHCARCYPVYCAKYETQE